MLGENIMLGAISSPCFTDTTDIFKDNSGVALYTLDYDASDTGGASGKFGEAAIFNGSSSNISINGSILNSRTAVSYSAWVYYRGTGSGQSYGHIISGGSTNSTAGGKAFGIAVRNSDDLLYIWASNSQSSFSSTALPKNVWTHLAITNSGGTAKMYMNGSLIHTSNPTSLAFNSSSNNLRIGEYFYNGSHHFYGKIDQVRIFNTVLTQSQITQLYQENSSTVGTHMFGCLANYNLDGSAKESMGTTAYDGTETDIKYKYNGTPTNVDFGVGGKSLYGARFNGSSSYITTPSVIPTNNFSFSFWVNMNSFPGSSTNQQVFTQNANNNRWYIAVYESGRIQAWNGSGTFTTSSSVINLNQWHNVVYTASSSNGKKIYVDGTEVLSNADTGNNQGTASGTNFIGFGKWYTNILYLDGRLDQARIFNKALSAAEISKLYGGGAGEIACKYTATTNTHMFGCIANYNLDNSAKESMGASTYDGTESNIEYRFGRYGQAAVFNGSNSQININNFTTLSQVGLSFWVNLPDVTSQAGLITKYAPSNREFAIYIYGGDMIASLYYNGNNGNAIIIDMTQIMSNNTWHHVAYSANGTNPPILWIDGVQTGTPQSSTNNSYYTTSEPIILGAFTASTAYALDGKIDQVRIYSTALTSSQVTELFNEKPETDTSNFKTVLYEGNNSTQYISNVGFQPDLVWVKSRDSSGYDHNLYDSVRGVLKRLKSQNNSAQDSNGKLSSFDANGFSLIAGGDANGSGQSMVAWCWKAGGAAVSNSNGTITSSVSANPAAGFSIVEWSGSGADGTVGHGLTATPELILAKRTNTAASWLASNGTVMGYLDDTDSFTSVRNDQYLSSFTTTTIGVKNIAGINASGDELIMYCWHSVSGYSKIGTYTGSNPTKVTVTLGFKPSWIMIKSTSHTYGWWMLDSQRSPTGDWDDYLYADTNGAEGTTGGNWIKPTANGFETNPSGGSVTNQNGVDYIYMAFK